jgi:hypothetical protein
MIGASYQNKDEAILLIGRSAEVRHAVPQRDDRRVVHAPTQQGRYQPEGEQSRGSLRLAAADLLGTVVAMRLLSVVSAL